MHSGGLPEYSSFDRHRSLSTTDCAAIVFAGAHTPRLVHGINTSVASLSTQKVKLSENELKRTIVMHLDSLRRFSFSLTGSGAEGDDLAHNTVERLLAKGVPSDVPFTAWMFRVCKNLWIDQLRARSRMQSADPEQIERELEPVDGAAEAMDRMRVHEVSSAIGKLPPNQRLVLGLVTVEGHSYREAAEILEIPIGTVMSRLARARKSLLELMHEVG